MKNFSILFLFVSFHSIAKIEVRNGSIFLIEEKVFEDKLELKSFVLGNQKESLRETGYILANTQSTYQLDRFSSKWVTLTDSTANDNDLNLTAIRPDKGLAYGVITTSIDFENEMKIGQPLSINRYGLNGDNFHAKILRVMKRTQQDIIQIHFLATNAGELIAGTSCEVTFQDVHFQSYFVSLLSLLHIGLEDYIVVKGKDGGYYPKHVTVIDQDAETAQIIVPVARDLLYVARGAILLKPLLNQIISHRTEL